MNGYAPTSGIVSNTFLTRLAMIYPLIGSGRPLLLDRHSVSLDRVSTTVNTSPILPSIVTLPPTGHSRSTTSPLGVAMTSVTEATPARSLAAGR